MTFRRLRSTDFTELAIVELIKRQKLCSSIIIRFTTFIQRAGLYRNRGKLKNKVKVKFDLNIVKLTEIV